MSNFARKHARQPRRPSHVTASAIRPPLPARSPNRKNTHTRARSPSNRKIEHPRARSPCRKNTHAHARSPCRKNSARDPTRPAPAPYNIIGRFPLSAAHNFSHQKFHQKTHPKNHSKNTRENHPENTTIFDLIHKVQNIFLRPEIPTRAVRSYPPTLYIIYIYIYNVICMR